MKDATATEVTGEKLIQLCAQKITQRDGNTKTIEARQRDVVTYTKLNDDLQGEIEAMQAAIKAGTPYAPPAAK
jgi:hypothetical protein